MTIVERAIEKLRRAGTAPGPAAPRAVGALVREEVSAEPDAVRTRRIGIDREALRAAGYLPESTHDRQFADHFRQIKRPLIAKAIAGIAQPGGASPRIIMMASALPGDGKTFTSINLALSLARERDFSVVLIDADVPKPHVSRIFGVEREPGMIEALTDPAVDVESLLLPTDVGSLSMLPAGKLTEGATELLASARMTALVARLLARNANRILLFDSSPLLVSSESRALAAWAGQVVLVVRHGSTPREAVLEAIDELGEHKEISLILNQGRIRSGGYYYGYGEYGAEG
jgi:exopolysaccharide/PEP-CTERM locus tyrosine autokinase